MSERRLFFAIDVPAAVREAAAQGCQALAAVIEEPVRWAPLENLHITLKFLGEIGDDRVPKLLSSVAGKLARHTAFEVSTGGLGAFPHAREASVLWLGLAQGTTPLARIARKLESSATRAGAARERRAFQPHLTLGRLESPTRIALERAPGPEPVSFVVEDVVLYESRLSATGASHVPLARLPLGAEEALSELIAPEP